jgi:hypothetical protein
VKYRGRWTIAFLVLLGVLLALHVKEKPEKELTRE